MYHRLAELDKNASELERTWTVSPRNFQAQMEMLVSRGFHTVTMSDLAAYLRGTKSLVSKPIVVSFDDGWETDYSVAFPILKRYKMSGTFYVYTNAIEIGQSLKWAQIDEMARGGMEFGSHTLSHPHLRAIPLDSARREIVESKAVLEKRLGRAITTFDYPSGEYDAQIVELVKRAGFESAVTIASGFKQRADQLFALHRTRVSYGDSVQDLLERLP
jgi:peptidoglycan/xylan/chitin deacetylase (PgdA/CDA1 family)